MRNEDVNSILLTIAFLLLSFLFITAENGSITHYCINYNVIKFIILSFCPFSPFYYFLIEVHLFNFM